MLVKCEKCGKFFGADDSSQTLCSACSTDVSKAQKIFKTGDIEEQKFLLARDVVYDHPDIAPDALIEQVSEAGLELSIKDVLTYVRDGRLTMKSVEGGVFCEDCGKKIFGGRLCSSCKSKLEKAITSKNKKDAGSTREVDGGSQSRKKAGMHTRSDD
ncbi:MULTISPECIES: hypothetical protein [unclassified Fusibacter]|uniref:hypothetical protein n=1 Tax=unclassified Fusibacter TaxID=2624464 RepID=UPI001011ADF6|nr:MULTISPECIES: hypothetical protein [unclassified Fusibacter]MCK8058646.1 hypothetical protein [Fusibacter sp. A2]NPE21721.1 hypothetical protein [Fusibacter sp. A1]RXV61295.1 hypothetical protein DWB64_07740 [Fusibacter sp. A1]